MATAVIEPHAAAASWAIISIRLTVFADRSGPDVVECLSRDDVDASIAILVSSGIWPVCLSLSISLRGSRTVIPGPNNRDICRNRLPSCAVPAARDFLARRAVDRVPRIDNPSIKSSSNRRGDLPLLRGLRLCRLREYRVLREILEHHQACSFVPAVFIFTCHGWHS